MEKEEAAADSLMLKLYKWLSRITSCQEQDHLALDTDALHSSSLILFQDTAWLNKVLHNTWILNSSIKTLHRFCSEWLALFSVFPLTACTLEHERSVFLHPPPSSLLISGHASVSPISNQWRNWLIGNGCNVWIAHWLLWG